MMNKKVKMKKGGSTAKGGTALKNALEKAGYKKGGTVKKSTYKKGGSVKKKK